MWTGIPTTKVASTQTVLKITDININSYLDECSKSKVSELRLNEFVDDLRSKVQERKSHLLLISKLGFALGYLPSLFSWHSSSSWSHGSQVCQ